MQLNILILHLENQLTSQDWEKCVFSSIISETKMQDVTKAQLAHWRI